MGFLSWLQRRGATGGIARWAFNGFRALREQRPDMTEYEICLELFRTRYDHVPLKDAERHRYDQIMAGEPDLTELRRLCMAIAEIEFGISAVEDPDLWGRTLSSVEEELDSLSRGASD